MKNNTDIRGFYDVYVPSLDRYISFKEISTGQQKQICKTLMAEEGPYKTEFLKCVIKTLQDNIIESVDVSNLNIVDCMCIMLGLRCASITPDLSLTITCNKCSSKHVMTCRLDDLYEKIINNYKNSFFDNFFDIKFPSLKKELEIMYLLKKHNSNKKDEVVLNLLRYINTDLDLKIFDEMELSDFQKVVQTIHQANSLFKDIIIYNIECPGDKIKKIECDRILCRFFRLDYATFYSFYNLMYGHDLKNIYKDVYFLSKLNIDPFYIESISSIDRSILWSVYGEEQKKKQKQKSTEIPPLTFK